VRFLRATAQEKSSSDFLKDEYSNGYVRIVIWIINKQTGAAEIRFRGLGNLRIVG
jgi:hypothetical protein